MSLQGLGAGAGAWAAFGSRAACTAWVSVIKFVKLVEFREFSFCCNCPMGAWHEIDVEKIIISLMATFYFSLELLWWLLPSLHLMLLLFFTLSSSRRAAQENVGRCVAPIE